MNTFTNNHKKHTYRKTGLAFGVALFIGTSAWASSTEDDDRWIEEVIEVQEMVEPYDQDGDQLLSSSEVQQGIDLDMQLYDHNRDNQFSLGEFESMWNTEVQQYAERMFYRLDTDNSQNISQSELAAVYEQLLTGIFTQTCIEKEDILNAQVLANAASLEIATMDVDRDGRLNYTEFSKTEHREMVNFFHELDSDGNGLISQSEYRAALIKLADAAVEIKNELPVAC